MLNRPCLRSSLLLCFSVLCAPRMGAQQDAWQVFVEAAEKLHGSAGAQAASYLREHRPAGDGALDAALLLENLEFALRARQEFPWSQDLPDALFHNDVLPYAVLDEARERWRPAMYARARELVAGCKTSGEAAQALNRQLFNATGVHYNTARKRPNQSPSESMASGRASCTGLSILLVDACRSVGIPARVAGVAQWNGKPGNHTWVEIWDGAWRFTGADEYDAEGLNRGWFQADASRALVGVEQHAVWASSWQRTGKRFPLAWDLESKAVSGLDVTSRYAARVVPEPTQALCNLRAWNRAGGERLELRVELLDPAGELQREVTTRAGTADLNDMPQLALVPGADYRLRIWRAQRMRSATYSAPSAGEEILELYWDQLGLTEQAAEQLIESSWRERVAELEAERSAEMEQAAFVLGSHRLRFLERSFGTEPEAGHSLWISMHGGGAASSEVNDAQWRNQIRLYELEEGIYVAPRAPTDTWNLWHEAHIDGLFGRLIDSFVALRGVDPERVYLLGYSAGGDGVYQLAPRMADRFAAACMMAGHPNEAQPLGLRNLPMGLFVGGQDAAYARNEVAAQWNDKLDLLQRADPDAYLHRFRSYPECGHWMDGQDAEGLPWMAGMQRNTWPKKVVWFQDDVLQPSAYWLQSTKAEARVGQLIRAEVLGQLIRVEGTEVRQLTLRLRDALIDLDLPIEVRLGERVVFQGMVARTEKSIRESLAARCDRSWAASARLDLEW